MSLDHEGSLGVVSEQVIAGYYQVIIFFGVSWNPCTRQTTWRGWLTWGRPRVAQEVGDALDRWGKRFEKSELFGNHDF